MAGVIRFTETMKTRSDFPRFFVLVFAIITSLGAAPIALHAQYATSFEPPVYVSGEINGQDTWTSTNPPAARIRTATELASDLTALGMNPGTTVHSGAQALLISSTNSGSSATIRPIGGFQTERFVTVEYWARPLTGGSLGNVFLVMEDSTNLNPGGRAAAVRFGTAFGNTIDYFSAGSWQPTSTIWNADLWYRLTLTADYLNKTYDFSIDGTQVNATPIPFYSATSADFSQVRIFRGANQAGIIVDDLLVVPEPATFACLLGGVAILLHRRRRR